MYQRHPTFLPEGGPHIYGNAVVYVGRLVLN